MLNRRILRIKAFKAIYSFTENPSVSLKELETQLDRSLESTRDLYLFLLCSISPISGESRARLEAARGKFNPSQEELHPNFKFADNLIAPILENDPDFQKIIQKKKFTWDQYDVLVRHLYDSIRSKDYYGDYLQSGPNTLKEDADLWSTVFEEEYEDNEELEAILEDLSIWWNDDLAYALTWCCRTMESLGKGKPWNLPPLFMSDMDATGSKESDKAFVTKLLRTAYSGYEKYIQMISEVTPKWDRSRICTTDLALIICGLAETDAFNNIAPKVTINEFVEISKYYSTPESRAFVNGILDKLIKK
ncbi:MAG: transcription antitermination protein NusB [Bacteroidales bacterium]|nr:transcription antitermination protein NusB [Bacteroidales bacterium]